MNYKMESLILCDGCQQELNRGPSLPKLLPKCGHTLCLKCIRGLQQKSGNPSQLTCSICGLRQLLDNGSAEQLLTNEKVLKIVDLVVAKQAAMLQEYQI